MILGTVLDELERRPVDRAGHALHRRRHGHRHGHRAGVNRNSVARGARRSAPSSKHGGADAGSRPRAAPGALGDDEQRAMPKIDIAEIQVDAGSNYPQAFRRVVAGRARKRLGNAAGLDQFGVNLTTLKPGAASALRALAPEGRSARLHPRRRSRADRRQRRDRAQARRYRASRPTTRMSIASSTDPAAMRCFSKSVRSTSAPNIRMWIFW